jgi:uncharacterized membrane-anchored protein
VVLLSLVGMLITDNMVENFKVSHHEQDRVRGVDARHVRHLACEREDPLHPLHPHRQARSVLWSAIVFTFALGTAAGDLIAEKYSLGYGKGLTKRYGLTTAVDSLDLEVVPGVVTGFL